MMDGAEKKIFIVDDQPDIRLLLELCLRGADRRLFLLASGEETLERAQQEVPDLILLDVMMPGGMDGYQTVRLLKGAEETRNIPVIMITAKGQEADRHNALAAGADDYIAKPFSLAEMKEKVSRFLS